MTLIKSISGIRGTIGGSVNDNLTPIDIVKYTTAYAVWLKQNTNSRLKVVVGRDGRISGYIVQQLVISTLLSMGIDVVDAGLSTTPTVEMAVVWEKADGGIIITASHNPKEWNALKLLNKFGEFISANDGSFILKAANDMAFEFASVDELGVLNAGENFINKHIEEILKYKWVNAKLAKNKRFKIVVDVINSTGTLIIPDLLAQLGAEVVLLNNDVSGKFAHNPEPLPENLDELSLAVIKNNADMGIAVDPDVDRLCFVCEDGKMFGEEYTLVAIADYILSKQKGNTVSNLSSSKALRDITEKHGCQYAASAVGEVNVVAKMKEVNAIIGGEGNGGIIVPDFHYGRDALIGIGLFLSAFAESEARLSNFRKRFPNYFISKNKITLTGNINTTQLLGKLKEKFSHHPLNTEDGLKIELPDGWVHLRTSNTEPIIRIYSESTSQLKADNIAFEFKTEIEHL